MNLMQLVSNARIESKILVIIYKTYLSTKSSLLLLLKFYFTHVELAWIIYNNKNLNFDVQYLHLYYLGDGTWYNLTIFSHLHVYSSKNFFNNEKKDRYDLKCDIDA